MTISNIILAGNFAQLGQLDDFTTIRDEYCVIGYDIPVLIVKHKQLGFFASGNNLLVTVLGDNGNNMFNEVAISEFTVIANADPVYTVVSGTYSALRVMVRPAVSMQNGTLSVGMLLES